MIVKNIWPWKNLLGNGKVIRRNGGCVDRQEVERVGENDSHLKDIFRERVNVRNENPLSGTDSESWVRGRIKIGKAEKQKRKEDR